MLNKIDLIKEINKFNFPDNLVQSMLLESNKKSLIIKMKSLEFNAENKWINLGEVTINIHDWNSLSILEYKHIDKLWENISEADYDEFTEICACEVSEDNEFTLEGFGKNKGWMMYKFTSVSAEVVY